MSPYSNGMCYECCHFVTQSGYLSELVVSVGVARGKGHSSCRTLLDDGAISTYMPVERGSDDAWNVLTGESCRNACAFVNILIAAIIPSALGRDTDFSLPGLDYVESFALLLAGTITSCDVRRYLAITSRRTPERSGGYRPRGELLCTTAATEYSMKM